MVLTTLLSGGDPVITGLALLIGLITGLFIIGAPFELVALISIPFCMAIIGFYIGAIVPVIAIGCGIIIGLAFIRLMRR